MDSGIYLKRLPLSRLTRTTIPLVYIQTVEAYTEIVISSLKNIEFRTMDFTTDLTCSTNQLQRSLNVELGAVTYLTSILNITL